MNAPAQHHSNHPRGNGSKLRYEAEELHFDSRLLTRLAEEVETPFFLVSEGALEANYHSLQRGLAEHGVQPLIRYCAKTNNEAGVLRTIAGLGSGILVSHLAEAQLALQSGFSPERIAFQRPVLDEHETRQVLAAGITFFHAFQETDLAILAEIARDQKTAIRISLRLRNASPMSALNPLGFYAQRLGFREAEIFPAVEKIQESEWLHLEALNFYCGTQQKKPKRYFHLLHRSARLAGEILTRYGIALAEINLGGGLPSPSMQKPGLRALRVRFSRPEAPQSAGFELETYAQSLSERFVQEFSAVGLPALPRIVVEPGRSIVGSAALLLTRVRSVRGRWVFLDASHNYLGENPYFLTRMILPCTQHTDRKSAIYNLSGSTLNTLDVIDAGRRLPRLEPGDLLALCDAGAYSISRATRYAGITPPVYILRSDGALECIRRAGDVGDLNALMTGEEITTPSVQ